MTIDFDRAVCVPFTEHLALPRESGVYVVRQGETALYIGQTSNFRTRWSTHHRRRDIEKFGTGINIYCFPMPRDEAVFTEHRFITELQPKLNSPKSFIQTYLIGEQPRRKGKFDRLAEEYGKPLREMLVEQLNQHGNVKATASALGVSYRQLFRKMEELKIELAEPKWHVEIREGGNHE